ncbi:hypothetical protein [Mycolicibacterium neworleansense]|uniref:hypothetical protein n=1 Tax=Mycolicibacterium neworleansense TaxID=146018 RepID=UPI00103CF667|nr:hypothetical protein [Mycolicibacterium neworleansense]MCV7365483.1 hypothetical protein [Mycolicibacterium neworleansense]
MKFLAIKILTRRREMVLKLFYTPLYALIAFFLGGIKMDTQPLRGPRVQPPPVSVHGTGRTLLVVVVPREDDRTHLFLFSRPILVVFLVVLLG